jgi:hypothetical protein
MKETLQQRIQRLVEQLELSEKTLVGMIEAHAKDGSYRDAYTFSVRLNAVREIKRDLIDALK